MYDPSTLAKLDDSNLTRSAESVSVYSTFDHINNEFGNFSRDSSLSSLGVNDLSDIRISHSLINQNHAGSILSVSGGAKIDTSINISDFTSDIFENDVFRTGDFDTSFIDLPSFDTSGPISSITDDYDYGQYRTATDFTDALDYWNAYEAARDVYNGDIELEDLWGDNTVDTSKSFENVYFDMMPDSAKDYTARAQGLYEKFGGEDLKIDVMDNAFKVTVDKDISIWDGLQIAGAVLVGVALGAPAALLTGMAIKNVIGMQQDIYSVGFGTKIGNTSDFQFGEMAELADSAARFLGDIDGIDPDTGFAITLAEGMYTALTAGMTLASGLNNLRYVGQMPGVQQALFGIVLGGTANSFIETTKSLSDLLGSSGNFVGDVYGAYEGGIGGSLNDRDIQSYLDMIDRANLEIAGAQRLADEMMMYYRGASQQSGALLSQKAKSFRFTDLSILKLLFTDSIGMLAGAATWNRNFGGHQGYNPMGEHFPDIFRARTQSSQYAGYYGSTVMALTERHNSQFSRYGGSNDFLETVLIGKL